MTDLVPAWLLDVDGVLNAVSREPDRSIWPDWRRGSGDADGVDWPIVFSPSVSGAIRRLHEDGLVEVRWLTTWRNHANGRLRQLLDLPELDVVPDATLTGGAGHAGAVGSAGATDSHGAASAAYAPDQGEWWKLAAVRALADELGDRPLIWTDDELATQPDALEWVRRTVADPLLIAPSPQAGLTPGHLAVIEDFCRLRAGRFD